ncbi:MAG: Protein RecA [Candidatus Wolfebacteria bacterium GW2011_GWC2_46_275]|uniref:Protein RecA n=2 Tax=Candidatus Wolfeibacteriota TaxID=1752735 RepID=A0A0G1U5M3_9BACT|nr:MAG: recombination protein RecA, recombination protein RecA [Candidatus Wolfebacteria bacterium GW2011_GWB1_47_1]KKU34870.1 MAG: Protein RecA [Candidatus Wolfebacteria bacterium GW2011_GWC2_46_275]KKU41458.1 MAG: Protein RecA [Candidatus Wolfebacteria bacterium GW2011_GWB2_46_69]KKU53386.1 MAG: Protein RecA [Candidatus Wolfebacteria bacterium GW2011_GWC1_47_103]KKU58836.1 MAG: Protein RecA [Candidatus Wolfebacteria bacterium GW2011_GWE2_47_12]KKU65423.1 MAG: Protein RecA [Candidatus Wolfeba
MAAKKQKQSEGEVKDIDQLLESMQGKFGDGAIMRLNDVRKVAVDVIPSGSFSLDIALGVGGYPKGRIVEIYGPESSGKTTLALHAIAEAQKKGGRAAFIDAEHALDPEYAKKLGVKVTDLLISQPDSGEEALNILESLVQSGILDIIIVDSVAALTPRAEIEGEMGAQFMGLQARLMGQALRKLVALADRKQVLIIFINQIREKIGVMFGSPETTPGGRALKFYSSVRLDIRRNAQIKKGEDVIGNRVTVKVVKNKVAPPFKNTEFDIMYGEGISYEGDIMTMGLKLGTIAKNGNTYSFEGEKLGVGVEAARDTLKANKKLVEDIRKKTNVAIAAAIKALESKEKESKEESKEV